MREGWKELALADVADVGAGNSAPQKKECFTDGTVPFVRTSDVGQIRVGSISDSRDKLNEACAKKMRLVEKGSILLPKSGASTFLNHRVMLSRNAYVSSHLATVKANPGQALDAFLHYFLMTVKAQDLIQDHKYPSLKLSDISAIRVSLPPLAEQGRIVAILDEAFAGIATAVANTDKNLANARELFESYLKAAFRQTNACWFSTSIGEQMTLQRGFDITKKDQKPGSIPVVSSGGIKSYHDTAMVDGPGVVIGRKGSLGTVHYVEGAYWPHDTTLWVKDFKNNNVRLVYYLLRSMDLKKLDSGAANPALNRNVVHPIPITWPAPEAQTKLVEALDTIAEETQRLASICQRKLIALEELKQSLLARAFSGELTATPIDEIETALA